MFCGESSRTELSPDGSGENDNGRGEDDGDSERRGGGSSTSGPPGGRVPGLSTGLADSLSSVFFCFDFFEYSLL